MYFALLHHPQERDYNLSSLKFCMTGGAPMPVEVMSAFERRFAVTILEGFGLSETSPVASFTMLDRPAKPARSATRCGASRWASSTNTTRCCRRRARRDRDSRPQHHEGLLEAPRRQQGNPAQRLFHSGDIGFRDADGCYFIVDRKKDMILRGGFNVYPREVEEVLYAHPAVAEAAVIGIAHDSHGEEVKAVVALNPARRQAPRNSSPGARNAWPPTSTRAPSPSWTRCRRGRPGRS